MKMEKDSVREVILDREVYGSLILEGKYEPDTLTEMQAWIDNMLSSIPSEYRDTAKIEIGSESSYEGAHFVTLLVYYDRPETDKEREAREKNESDTRMAREVDERKVLATLKAKYEE